MPVLGAPLGLGVAWGVVVVVFEPPPPLVLPVPPLLDPAPLVVPLPLLVVPPVWLVPETLGPVGGGGRRWLGRRDHPAGGSVEDAGLPGG